MCVVPLGWYVINPRSAGNRTVGGSNASDVYSVTLAACGMSRALNQNDIPSVRTAVILSIIIRCAISDDWWKTSDWSIADFEVCADCLIFNWCMYCGNEECKRFVGDDYLFVKIPWLNPLDYVFWRKCAVTAVEHRATDPVDARWMGLYCGYIWTGAKNLWLINKCSLLCSTAYFWW